MTDKARLIARLKPYDERVLDNSKNNIGVSSKKRPNLVLPVIKNTTIEAILQHALSCGLSMGELEKTIGESVNAKVREATRAQVNTEKVENSAKKAATVLGDAVPVAFQTKQYKKDNFPPELLRDQDEFKKAESLVNAHNALKAKGEVFSYEEREIYLRSRRFINQARPYQPRRRPLRPGAKPGLTGQRAANLD